MLRGRPGRESRWPEQRGQAETFFCHCRAESKGGRIRPRGATLGDHRRQSEQSRLEFGLRVSR